jgi:hypothetical protein
LILVVVGLFGKAFLDILSGDDYLRAILTVVLVPCALYANRLLQTQSTTLRAIGRLFWSAFAGFGWTVLLMGAFVFARTHILGENSSEVIPWLKWAAAATFLTLVSLAYRFFLVQERTADENVVSDVSGTE